MIKKKFLNLSLRISILGGKFLSIVSMAKFMTPTEFGLYNLIVAYAAFAVLFYGLDFYAYTHRHYAKNEDKKKASISHITYSTSIIIFISPFSYFFLRMEKIEAALAVIITFLFAFEYISQELYRYLIVENRQIEASIGMFLRTTVWFPPLLGFGFISGKLMIYDVVIMWLIGGGISIAYYLKKIKFNPKKYVFKINRDILSWIIKGVVKSFKFLLATLAVKLIFTIDRKSAQIYSSMEEVAIYGFCASFAMVIFTIIDATILSYSYPKILSEEQDPKGYKILLWSIVKISFLTLPIVCMVMAASIFIMNLNERYFNLNAYILASLAVTFYAMSMAPHYYLYSHKRDKALVGSHLFMATVSVILFFFIYKSGEASVISFKLAVIMLGLFLLKHFLWSHSKKSHAVDSNC